MPFEDILKNNNIEKNSKNFTNIIEFIFQCFEFL